jgi:hypothetical protein
MTEWAAMRVALSLLHLPATVRQLKQERLPDGVEGLLRIVAGEDVLERDLAIRFDRPGRQIREAAAFFIVQVLLDPAADSYRHLGGSSESTTDDLRRNMALLVRWLHPDRTPSDGGALVGRVTRAWDNVKTPARRSEYDRMLAAGKLTGSRGGLAGRDPAVKTGPAIHAAPTAASNRLGAAWAKPVLRWFRNV